MRPETQALVNQVEALTGLPVYILAMEELPVDATITLSSGATGGYLLRYRQGLGYKDYAIAVQCCHLLRALALPEGERRQFSLDQTALEWGTTLVRRHFKKKPKPPDQLLGLLVSQLVGGLFTQLRSIPVGMRCDAWLGDTYPSLADLFADSAAIQQQEALGSLSPAVKAMAPDEIIAGSVIMNAAYAIFCDRHLGTTKYAVPYVSAGFGELGQSLLDLFDQLDPEPASDAALVDAWATELGLSGKYRWVPQTHATQVS